MPSPQPPISRTPLPLVVSPPPNPPPSLVQVVPSPSPPSDQENICSPLEELVETPLDPYLPPACIQNPSPVHPHQFFLLELDRQQVWRPISEGQVTSFLNLPSHSALLDNPTLFLMVMLFKGYSPHVALTLPTISVIVGKLLSSTSWPFTFAPVPVMPPRRRHPAWLYCLYVLPLNPHDLPQTQSVSPQCFRGCPGH
jgi:hypothetical protein